MWTFVLHTKHESARDMFVTMNEFNDLYFFTSISKISFKIDNTENKFDA